MQPEYSAHATTRNWSVFFWAGLIGIVATGLMVGVGGDNFWALSRAGGAFGEPSLSPTGPILFLVGVVMVGFFDLSAVGAMFTGGVILVLRFQGRE
jgi:hypothetical protein